MTGDFVHTCQSVSGTHLPTCPSTTPRGAILLLLALTDERGTWCCSPLDSPKIDPVSLVLLGSSESSLSWHIVRKLCKVAICPGMLNPNFKYKWDMIPLNLDQIPLSLQRSVTHWWRVWPKKMFMQCYLRLLLFYFNAFHSTVTVPSCCLTLWNFKLSKYCYKMKMCMC